MTNNAATGSSGTDLDGVIGVIPSGGGAYSMLSKIGGVTAGTGSTLGASESFYGISIGFFDTLLITGYSCSSDFPLGTGASSTTRFQNTFGGVRDAIIGKVPRTGGSGTWQATYIGGSGDDVGNSLRAFTPYGVLMYGESQSTNFPTKNVTTGSTSFYSATNAGGWDMVFFTILSDLKTLKFSTYIGGNGNDYLGATGVPRGSNQFKVMGDTSIIVGTTSHSQSNFLPKFIGLGAGGVSQGISAPLFDTIKSNTNNDSHIIYEWGDIKSLLNFEYGDAPTSYGTPKSNIVGSIKIGALIDGESQYPISPGRRANVDDNTNLDDEDGIAGTSIPISRLVTTYTTPVISVTNTTGVTAKLIGFIDFNGNGIFDANESASATVPNGATSATLTWSGFTITSASDTSFLRLRLTTDTSVTNTPSATKNQANGEIEDYLVLFNCPTITVNITPSNTNVCSGTAVTLTGSASGGSNSFTWSWSPGGATTSTITPTITANVTYTLTARDVSTGCPGSKSQSITVITTPVFTGVSGTNPTTCGGANGSITITGVSPATGSYTVTYTKNAANQSLTTTATGGVITISGLGAGTYTAFVIAQGGCNSSQNNTSIVLADPSGPTGTITGPATGCANAALSSYTVNPINNCSSCTYAWSASNGGSASTPTAATTNITFTQGGAQTASVIITNSSNCATTLTKAVTVTGIPTVSGVSVASCVGTAADVTVNATVNPTATLEYALDGSSTYQSSTVLLAVPTGAHTVTARVVGTTCASTSFSFNVNCTCGAVPTVSIGGLNSVCANGGTVTLTSTITGATIGTWSVTSGGGLVSPTACSGSGCTTTYTSGASGTATISITTNDPDGAGPCVAATTTKSITVNPIPTVTGATVANTNTCGGSNGSITLTGVTPAGGTFTVTYNKASVGSQNTTATASGTNLVIAGLTAGTYSNFTISQNGCISATLAGPFTITDPSAPTGTVSGPTGICQSVTTSAFSISNLQNCSSCSYSWSSTGGTAATPTSATTGFTFNSSGNQTVSVTITNTTTTCSSTINGSFLVNGIPVISNATQASCVGNAADVTINASVTPTATLQYSLDGGAYQNSNVFLAVVNGSHTVTAKVLNTTCTSSTFTFSVSCACSAPPAASISGNSATCSNTPVTLTSTINNASTGTWAIVSGGGSLSTTACSGSGCTTVYTPTAGTSGIKTIRMITDDPDGVGPCIPDTAIFTINVTPTPTIGGGSGSNPTTCSGANGSVTLTGVVPATGSYNISYTKNGSPQSATATVSSNSLVISGLTAGTYANFVITQNGCPSNSFGSFTLVDPTPPSGSITGPTSVCNGAVSTAYSVNNLLNCSSCNYVWSSTGGSATTANATTSTFTFSSLGAQTVNLAITNSTTNCTTNLSYNVTVNGIPVVSTVSQSACTGTAADVTVNASVSPSATLEYALDGSASYQSSNIFAAVADGSHTVTVRVVGTTCASSPYSFTVNCHCVNNPSATITGPAVVCTNSSITLTSTITNATSGTWSVTGGGSVLPTNCSGTGCTTTYTAGATSGTVTIQFVTNDPDGVGPCLPFTTTKTITVNQTPTITSATAHNTSTCGGNDGYVIVAGVTPANATFTVNYNKNGVPQTATLTAVGTNLTIPNLTAGTYTNIVVTLNGCTSNTAAGPFTVVDPTPPSGTVSGPSTACQGVVTTAYSITGLTNFTAGSYLWSSSNGTATTPNAATSTFTFTSTGTQTAQVTITSSNNCSSTISQNVTVNGVPTVNSVSLGACVGFTTTATVNASVNPLATLEYALDGGAYQSSNIFSGVGNGSHSVTARVVGTSCASAGSTFTVNCNCATPASASITSNNNPICSNSTATLTAILTNAATATWSIVSGGGSLSTPSCSGSGCTTVYTPTSSGTKVIRIITSDPDGVGPCTNDTVQYSLLVNPTPTISFNTS